MQAPYGLRYVTEIDSPESLAQNLYHYIWPDDLAFRIARPLDKGYLFVNDSLSVQGEQQFAILIAGQRPGESWQIGNLLIGEQSEEALLATIREFLTGDHDLPEDPEWQEPITLEFREHEAFLRHREPVARRA